MKKTRNPAPLYVNDPSFAEAGIEAELFPPGAALPALPPPLMLSLDNLDQVRAAVLSKASERRAFLQFNFARKRAVTARPAAARPRWAERAAHMREFLLRTNIALVGHAYGLIRHRLADDHDSESMFSDGGMSLLHAVDYFDVSRGYKFSTYAVRSVINGFANHGIRATKRASRFPKSELTDKLQDASIQYHDNDDVEREDDAATIRDAMVNNATNLTDTQRRAIQYRFYDNLTLEEAGEKLGMSKEAVRQSLNKAFTKLRETLAPVFGEV